MSFQPDPRQLARLKFVLFMLCLLPAGRLLIAAVNDDFGPNPVEFVQRWTGTWTFNFLLLTLCVTPLRVIGQWPWLIRLHRMLGLFSFFYACLHFLAFIGFDHDFVPEAIARDVFKRPFVTVGFAAFVIMVALALTSSNRVIRWLGGKRWQELHRGIYLIGILACIHYFWLVKATALLWPLAYSLMLALLLGWRIRERLRKAMPIPKIQAAKPLRFFKQKPD